MGNTILLADKSITIQKIVELTFSDENYQIKCVNDGQSALEAIPSIRPSIILADINLPVKSGYDVCHQLRTDPALAEFATIPVVLLAGIYETMDEDRAREVENKVREVGANDLLSKPFDPQVLTSKVKELMGGGENPATTAEIPAPAAPSPFLDEPAEQQGIFSAVPETAIQGLEMNAEPMQAPPPPDDSEKTMMLPSPLSFSGSMFAEMPPMENMEAEPEPESTQRNMPVESMTPASEPVFEMTDLESAPQPEVAEEPEEPVEAEEPAGGAFGGREEAEFSFDTQPGVKMTPPAPPEESPFADVMATPIPTPPSVVTAGDDPFGDVFAESPAPAPETWQTGSFDEDSPFGIAEPPPPPPAPPEPPPAPPVSEITQPSGIPVEETWKMEEPVAEAPMVEEAESAESEADNQRVLEEMMAVPELKPEFGEDTWSRARKVAEGPVEELFDTETHAEEAVELQPDLSESAATEEPETKKAAQEVSQLPVSTGGAVEITDELIDRIAARVVAKLSERVVSEIVWQVVPDLAEKMIRRELEKLNAGEE
jgi:CheY-like chemotaxis protein